MDKLYFNQTGGFPLSTNILNAMQQAYGVFNAMGDVMGNLAILSGCGIAGNNVADGVVYIDGEVLPFRGGYAGKTVIITKDTEDRIFEDGATKIVLEKRYACFGSATPNYAFTDFKRITKTLPQLTAEKAEKSALDALIQEVAELKKKAAVFTAGGGMVLWNKPANEIPAGWMEVINWRGRMPVGWDANNPAFDIVNERIGGSEKVVLTKDQIPSHHHRIKSPEYRSYVSGRPNAAEENIDNTPGIVTNQDLLSYNSYTSDTGGGQAHDNMPPYRVVIFIEYVG